MTTIVAPVAATGEVEAVYRQDGDRLWRALYAFAGDDPLPSADPSEIAAGVARIGQRIAIIRNPQAPTAGSVQEAWDVWVGTLGHSLRTELWRRRPADRFLPDLKWVPLGTGKGPSTAWACSLRVSWACAQGYREV